MAAGICSAVYTCDRDGEVDTPPLSPSAPKAVSISFEIDGGVVVPSPDQLDLKRDVERVLHAITKLFLDPKNPCEEKFRPYYVQLLKLSQLGLVGPSPSPEIAKRALESVTSELIDNEGGNVKNGHLQRLTGWAVLMSIPFLAIYTSLRLIDPKGALAIKLDLLGIEPKMLSCFMLLWIGCFIGVVLSYGARTTTMSLNDLINTDADRLLPQVRLLFAGGLTMVFGIFLLLGVIELKVGGTSTQYIDNNLMLAFFVGAICGVSELALPGTVSKKASDILGLK